MIRDLDRLANEQFDIAVIGGGIFGICAAWDATCRGLRVALVEQGDFAHATSANSFRMVHGGIRYLQHLDLPRIRESVRERRALLRIAPHLVHPLPIVIPTRGRGVKGRSALRAGLAAYDLFAWDRNDGIADPDRRIPPGRLLSRDEVLGEFPNIPADGLTGGALFHDAQMYNPPRLALAFLRSAVDEGAAAANYAEATGLLGNRDRVTGVRVRDRLSGRSFDVQARMVLLAGGAWSEPLLRRALNKTITPPSTFSRDACLVVARRLVGSRALAVLGRTRDPDAVLSRGERHLFLVPWHDHTLVGVWHVVHRGRPEEFTVTREEIESFLDEIDAAYPALQLTADDVCQWNAGLVLFGENEPGSSNLRYGHRSRIVDHATAHDVEGLITVIGVRWTTARGVAERAVRLACARLGLPAPPSRTDTRPVAGGGIDGFAQFAATAMAERPAAVPVDAINQLTRNHGSQLARVLAYGAQDPTLFGTLHGASVLRAEVVHAVREEAAVALADVVFRRTDLGSASHPGEAAIRECAALMAAELGWNERRREAEIRSVLDVLERGGGAADVVFETEP